MKLPLMILLLAGILLLSACENLDLSKVSQEDAAKIANATIVCNKPYIRFGSSCCLDQNENSVCDKDEGGETSGSECIEDKCDGVIYYQCVNGNFVNKGQAIGKCNVECLIDSDCATGYSCQFSALNLFYKCIEARPSPPPLPTSWKFDDMSSSSKCKYSVMLYSGCKWEDDTKTNFILKIQSVGSKTIPGLWFVYTGDGEKVKYVKINDEIPSGSTKSFNIDYSTLVNELGVIKQMVIYSIEEMDGISYACINQRIYTIPEQYCKI